MDVLYEEKLAPVVVDDLTKRPVPAYSISYKDRVYPVVEGGVRLKKWEQAEIDFTRLSDPEGTYYETIIPPSLCDLEIEDLLGISKKITAYLASLTPESVLKSPEIISQDLKEESSVKIRSIELAIQNLQNLPDQKRSLAQYRREEIFAIGFDPAQRLRRFLHERIECKVSVAEHIFLLLSIENPFLEIPLFYYSLANELLSRADPSLFSDEQERQRTELSTGDLLADILFAAETNNRLHDSGCYQYLAQQLLMAMRDPKICIFIINDIINLAKRGLLCLPQLYKIIEALTQEEEEQAGEELNYTEALFAYYKRNPAGFAADDRFKNLNYIVTAENRLAVPNIQFDRPDMAMAIIVGPGSIPLAKQQAVNLSGSRPGRPFLITIDPLTEEQLSEQGIIIKNELLPGQGRDIVCKPKGPFLNHRHIIGAVPEALVTLGQIIGSKSLMSQLSEIAIIDQRAVFLYQDPPKQLEALREYVSILEGFCGKGLLALSNGIAAKRLVTETTFCHNGGTWSLIEQDRRGLVNNREPINALPLIQMIQEDNHNFIEEMQAFGAVLILLSELSKIYANNKKPRVLNPFRGISFLSGAPSPDHTRNYSLPIPVFWESRGHTFNTQTIGLELDHPYRSCQYKQHLREDFFNNFPEHEVEVAGIKVRISRNTVMAAIRAIQIASGVTTATQPVHQNLRTLNREEIAGTLIGAIDAANRKKEEEYKKTLRTKAHRLPPQAGNISNITLPGRQSERRPIEQREKTVEELFDQMTKATSRYLHLCGDPLSEDILLRLLSDLNAFGLDDPNVLKDEKAPFGLIFPFFDYSTFEDGFTGNRKNLKLFIRPWVILRGPVVVDYYGKRLFMEGIDLRDTIQSADWQRELGKYLSPSDAMVQNALSILSEGSSDCLRIHTNPTDIRSAIYQPLDKEVPGRRNPFDRFYIIR